MGFKVEIKVTGPRRSGRIKMIFCGTYGYA
jgi:hypothetical protein